MDCRKLVNALFFFLLISFLTACAPNSQPNERVDLDQNGQEANRELEQQPDQPEEDNPGGTVEEEDSLPLDQPTSGEISTSGPWLVYSGLVGLYAANQDGSGFSMIHEYAVARPYVANTRIWAAPSGGRVAVLELIYYDNGINLRYPNLKIIRIPGGEVEFEQSLVPQAWLDDGLEVSPVDLRDDYSYQTRDGLAVDQVFAATGIWNEMTWSHDGSLLAFNAAIDGESADLYVYDTQDGSLLRLTDGPSQSVLPVFSPDDRYIVHGAVESLNWGFSGYGYDYLNIWAARSDGSGVERVYNQEFYGIERVLGWLSDTEYLVASEDVWCGFYDLRVGDVNDGIRYSLASGIHNSNAFSPEDGKLLFSLADGLGGGDCPERQVETGVYLLDTVSRQIEPVSGINANEVWQMAWNQSAGAFYVATQMDMYRVSPSGQLEVFQSPSNFSFDTFSLSPDGRHWIFLSGRENMIATGGLSGSYQEFIITIEPRHPVWVFESTLAVFLVEENSWTYLLGSDVNKPQPRLLVPELWSPNSETPLLLVNP